VTFTFWNYNVLKLFRFETITFSDATLSDINVVLCYVLSQYPFADTDSVDNPTYSYVNAIKIPAGTHFLIIDNTVHRMIEDVNSCYRVWIREELMFLYTWQN
jgi:hypothetical protein